MRRRSKFGRGNWRPKTSRNFGLWPPYAYQWESFNKQPFLFQAVTAVTNLGLTDFRVLCCRITNARGPLRWQRAMSEMGSSCEVGRDKRHARLDLKSGLTTDIAARQRCANSGSRKTYSTVMWLPSFYPIRRGHHDRKQRPCSGIIRCARALEIKGPARCTRRNIEPRHRR